jgi:hypothetical protein
MERESMRIEFTPEQYIQLNAVKDIVGNREFSGYGFVNIEKVNGEVVFKVYDIVLLDVRSQGYTEISQKKIARVLSREDASHMRLWFHRHPIGSGKPGPFNWSITDKIACTQEPLGSVDRDRLGWALAAVLTPGGWVGRVDKFKDGTVTTKHIPVGVSVDNGILDDARQLLDERVEREAIESSTSIEWESGQVLVDEALALIGSIEFEVRNKSVNGLKQDYLDTLDWCEDVLEENDALLGIFEKFREFQKIRKLRKALHD